MNESCLSLSITMKMFGWSKWGGANQGLFTLLPSEVWYCQCCGEKQTRNLPSYMIPMDSFNRDFVKVCTKCKYKSIIKKIKHFLDLRLSLKTPSRI